MQDLRIYKMYENKVLVFVFANASDWEKRQINDGPVHDFAPQAPSGQSYLSATRIPFIYIRSRLLVPQTTSN
jgi:hypothetical protein